MSLTGMPYTVLMPVFSDRILHGGSRGLGLCLVLFALSGSFWLSRAILGPAGFAMIVQMASSNTLVQTLVPDELRGRVMLVCSMMFLGMAPFGSLLAGAFAQHAGALAAVVVVGGAACMTAAALFASKLPSLRPGLEGGEGTDAS